MTNLLLLLLLLQRVEGSLETLGLAQVSASDVLQMLDLAMAFISLGLEPHLPILLVLLLRSLERKEKVVEGQNLQGHD